MKLSAAGIDMIHKGELLRLTAYWDENAYAIGWGTNATSGVKVFKGMRIDKATADRYFDNHLTKNVYWRIAKLNVSLTQPQFDALCSFCYNTGNVSTKFRFIRLIKAGEYAKAIEAWKRTAITGKRTKKTYASLIRRRKAEAEMFASGTVGHKGFKSINSSITSDPSNSNILLNGDIEKKSLDELLLEAEGVSIGKDQLYETLHNETTNRFKAFEALSIKEKREYNNGDDAFNPKVDYPISNGVKIYVPIKDIEIANTYESNITETKTSFKEYFPPLLKEIINDPGYVPAILNRGVESKSISPQLTVWIWSRTKYLESGNSDGFIEVTKDIISCDTETSLSDGGNFSLQLSPKNGRLLSDQGEYDPTQGKSKWQAMGEVAPGTSLGTVNKSRLHSGKRGMEYERVNFYYPSVLQQNDLVFISFEKLEIDGHINKESVAGRWYDMIGLVDVVKEGIGAQTNDVSVSVSGRDLTKALTDDQSYFNPYSIGHINSIFGGQLKDRYLQGEFREYSAFAAKSIKEAIEFIYNRIVSIGYVPDDIFSEFTNKTKSIIKYKDTEVKKVNGIWQLNKVFIDDSIKDLRLVDDSISNPNGSILDLFKKVAQEPFVEFFSDTYGDKHYWIFREPPFTHAAIKAVLNNNSNNQLIKREGISGGPSESALNTWKIKEDEFHKKRKSTVQKDHKDDLIRSQAKDIVINSDEFPPVINVNEEDVLREDLKYSNEAYAWYKVTDRGNYAGATVTTGTIPAVYFDEYAQVFGNKMLDVVSNYSNCQFFDHKKKKKDLDLYAEQASHHLAFLVETSIYLPFTREGTITLNGDRRLKKGHWIFYRPTQELFYITAVTNSMYIADSTIDRSTTISVVRGMAKEYLYPQIRQVEQSDGTMKEVQVSYFSLLNIDKFRDRVYDIIKNGSALEKFDYKSDMNINKDVFNFFLKRKHLGKYYAFENTTTEI